MPDYRSNMTMNPQNAKKTFQFNNVNDCLNQIGTYFKCYSVWNEVSEKCAVSYDLRGLARVHEKLGERANCDFAHFGKKTADHPWGIVTMVDWQMVSHKAEMGNFKYDELMNHMLQWSDNLSEMRDLFTEAAWYLADHKEATLYRCLLDYVAQIENEIWAIEVIIDRITFDNYQHADIKSVFKKLHCYFADEWDGGKIDFDI